MSIFLTEELIRHTADLKTSDLVFFFCGAEDENRNSSVNVLRGLVHQILLHRPELIGYALPYFEKPERARQTLSSLEALWIIFSKLITDDRLGTIFCVLDGLDECEEETMRSLLRRFLDLLTAQCSNKAKSLFKLAIVSRDMPILRGCTTVKLDPDHNQEIESDVSTFVRSRLKDLFWIDGFEHIQELVQAALLERAEGTFLWVGFAMHELSRTRTCKQIRETLNCLPSGLPAIYGRMLLGIPPDQRDSARTLLQWAAFAVRPLRLQELAAAMSTPESLPRSEVKEAVRDLVMLCGPLLRTEEPRETPQQDGEIVGGQEISLVHQSVRDYLLRSDPDSHAVLETFRFDREIIHLQLAQRCLDYMRSRTLQLEEYQLLDATETQHWLENPLLEYAALYWPQHANQSQALATKLYQSHNFFRPKEKALRVAWWDYCEIKRWGQHNYPWYRKPLPPLLHVACILGLMPLIEVVLGQQDWTPRMHRRIDQQRDDGNTPLHIAAREDHLAIARLLLQKGAKSNLKNRSRHTPLGVACVEGNETIVRLLLDKGAEPTPRSPDFDQLLNLAAEGGNEATVRLLLDMGARPTVPHKKRNWTALHLAARAENEAIVELLIERGADVAAKAGANHQTPLHCAAGDSAISKLLIDNGANVNVLSDHGMTPLHYAVRRDAGAVQLLLDCGADINAKDRIGDSPLLLAAAYAREAELQILLIRGADMKMKNLFGHGALYQAAHFPNRGVQDSQRKVIRMLIERGANVEELNNEEEAAAYRNCKRALGERSDAWEYFWS